MSHTLKLLIEGIMYLWVLVGSPTTNTTVLHQHIQILFLRSSYQDFTVNSFLNLYSLCGKRNFIINRMMKTTKKKAIS